jgi:uncharacterized small protein (DUF1192 family)
MYVVDQLGVALAEANRRITELEEEIARLRAEQPGADGEPAGPTAFTRE